MPSGIAGGSASPLAAILTLGLFLAMELGGVPPFAAMVAYVAVSLAAL